MIVQFDLGNSSAKWRVLDARRVPRNQGLVRHGDPWPEALRTAVESSVEVQVSSVADREITAELIARLEKRTARPVQVAVAHKRQLGLVNAYQDPDRMGVDRWLAMLAAWHARPQALMVVDAGSALTVDIIDGKGLHQGGYILPGRGLMRSSLQQGTSRVLFEPDEDAGSALGVDTQSCVARGLNWLWWGIAERLKRTADEYHVEALWITGGDAGYLRSAGLPGRYMPDLVLDGLALYCDDLIGR